MMTAGGAIPISLQIRDQVKPKRELVSSVMCPYFRLGICNNNNRATMILCQNFYNKHSNTLGLLHTQSLHRYVYIFIFTIYLQTQSCIKSRRINRAYFLFLQTKKWKVPTFALYMSPFNDALYLQEYVFIATAFFNYLPFSRHSLSQENAVNTQFSSKINIMYIMQSQTTLYCIDMLQLQTTLQVHISSFGLFCFDMKSTTIPREQPNGVIGVKK